MPKIVLQIVPAVFQYVMVPVLYLPPRTPAVRDVFRALRCYLFVRYPAAVERPLLLFVPDAQLQPVLPSALIPHLPYTELAPRLPAGRCRPSDAVRSIPASSAPPVRSFSPSP